MAYVYRGSQRPPTIKIVSEKEAKDSLSNLLNSRLNTLNNKISAAKIRTELSIDLEKSFVPAATLSSIVNQIECRDPSHHFEHDPRDDYVKFLNNGETYESMRPEIQSTMPLPSSSQLPKNSARPVEKICDTINDLLRKQKSGKLSVERVYNAATLLCDIEYEDLMEFINIYIETGDIHGVLLENRKLLEYTGEGNNVDKRVDERMNVSMRNLNVDDNEKRRNDNEWREEREDKYREDEKKKDYGMRRDEDDKWSKEDEWNKKVDEAERMKYTIEKTFPHIRHLNYLIYLLQKVVYDEGRDVLYMDTFEKKLDEIVGGDFNYDLFGITVFSELIYHRLVEIVERRRDGIMVRLNRLIEVNVQLLKGYLAVEVYNYVLKNKRATYKEIYEYIDHKDSQFLHEQFPKWHEWGEKEKIEDVRAVFKSNYEVFILKDDYLSLNPTFMGLIASPFVKY